MTVEFHWSKRLRPPKNQDRRHTYTHSWGCDGLTSTNLAKPLPSKFTCISPETIQARASRSVTGFGASFSSELSLSSNSAVSSSTVTASQLEPHHPRSTNCLASMMSGIANSAKSATSSVICSSLVLSGCSTTSTSAGNRMPVLRQQFAMVIRLFLWCQDRLYTNIYKDFINRTCPPM